MVNRYQLNQSPFYRLGTKRKLLSLLGISQNELIELLRSNHYGVFKNDKGRQIQHPNGKLKPVHKRISKLLNKILLPEYIHSQKTNSYITNAKKHIGEHPVIKTDIANFYPSITFSRIFGLFKNTFKCTPDISWTIAKLCTFNNSCLPTGSPISGIIAFLSSQEMFDEVNELALKHDCIMTCYVDDITISGTKATKSLLIEVGRVIQKHGLKIKEAKSRSYSAKAPKLITGCIIRGQNLLLPNKRHKEIWKLKKALNSKTSIDEEKDKSELIGRIQEAKSFGVKFIQP